MRRYHWTRVTPTPSISSSPRKRGSICVRQKTVDSRLYGVAGGVVVGWGALGGRTDSRFCHCPWTDCESALHPVPKVDKECNGRASGPSIALQAYVCTASPQRFERSTPANEGGQDE